MGECTKNLNELNFSGYNIIILSSENENIEYIKRKIIQ